MKKLTLSALTFATVLTSDLVSAADNGKVNIWNWSDYIAENTVSSFSKSTGLEVNYVTFDSNEMVEARLLSGKTGFDATMMVSYYIPRLAQAGALEPIDKKLIPNWSNLDEKRLEILRSIDPDNKYAYPYTEISLGIGYNKKKIDEIFGKDFKVDSWDFLFKKENSDKLKQCGIAVLDSPIEIISAAMHYLGKDPNSDKASDYKEAQKLLTVLAGNVRYFHSSRYINELASGDICAAIGYSGDILQANERAKQAQRDYEIKYVFPKEGSLLWFDCWVIPKDPNNYAGAHQWFNYLQNPDVAKSISNEIRYILPIKGAMNNLDPELSADPNVNLAKELLEKAYFPKPPSAKVSRITNRVWNTMKLNAESSGLE